MTKEQEKQKKEYKGGYKTRREWAEKHIPLLVKTIIPLRKAYHDGTKMEYSVDVLESLKRELSELEEEFPDLIQKDSPSQTIV